MVELLPSVHEAPGLSPKVYKKRKRKEGKEEREERGEEKGSTSKIKINTLFFSCYPKYTGILGHDD